MHAYQTALAYTPVITVQRTTRSSRQSELHRIDLGPRFDKVFATLAAWIVVGLFLDGWAHYHEKLDTFFTPWHAVLYSGFLATAGYMVWTVAPLRRRPLGYDLSVAGAVLFLMAGMGDLVWHTLFGIEQNEEAVFSPTHLLLATGGILLVTGPIRASWHRTSSELGERIPWPALLTLGSVLFTFTLFVEYSHPFFDPLIVAGQAPTSSALALHTQMHGVLGMLVHSALLTGMVLFALRRWSLPTGSLTFLIGTSGALLSVLHDQQELIPIVVLAGGAADALAGMLRPSATRLRQLRLFALAMPAAYYSIYLIALQRSLGIWWSIHVSTGAVVLSGIVGLLLSLLAAPPSAPECPPSSYV